MSSFVKDYKLPQVDKGELKTRQGANWLQDVTLPSC